MTADLKLIQGGAAAEVDSSVIRRGEILRHVTDLFIVGSDQYSEEQIARFDDIFTRLASQIEVSARALLALRLAPVPRAPPRIIRALAFDDDIDVAGPVLAQSERLDDQALLENARTKSQEHLLAISRRRALSESVTDVLVERGDKQVVLNTVANQGARFSAGGLELLVLRSDGDDELTESASGRVELPRHLFLRLLAAASQNVRAKLETEHPRETREVHQAVAEVTSRIHEEAVASAADFSAAQTAVEHLHRAGELDEGRLAVFAKAGQVTEITVALALMSDLPLHFADRAMRHERSDTLLVLAKALGLSWSTVRLILLLRRRDHASSVVDIAQCQASFERLAPETAKEIVQFYRRREGNGLARPAH